MYSILDKQSDGNITNTVKGENSAWYGKPIRYIYSILNIPINQRKVYFFY
jgi:hypothetical protein